MDFADKKVLITGASRGIGFAAAQEFLALGARVAINGRTEQSVATAIAELDAGDRVVAAPGGVGTVDGCESVVRGAVEGLGGLDVLVNNAGVAGPDSTIEKVTEAIWDETLDVNLKGTFFCSRAAVSELRAAGGSIVNTASVAGLQGFEGVSVYCASKGGVVNLTRAMAVELAPEIRVNCVCPGYVDTDMVRRDYIDLADDPAAAEREAIEEAPLMRMATPEEIAKAIVYLASHDARFITGVALPMDGGGSAGR
jgi:NAD(P)-dependent dehydrogenase (short-subunit alcohol dehydrogenase family)